MWTQDISIITGISQNPFPTVLYLKILIFKRSKRPMSLVDTSGQNRSCLPMSPYHEAAALELPWTLGFADGGAWTR
jgi:hypothetical protein